MTAATRPRRGEVWRTVDGVALLVLQIDVLNDELDTTVGVVVTPSPQQAPAPVRIALPADDTTFTHPVWAKPTLVRTVVTGDLVAPVAAVGPRALDAVAAAVARTLRVPPSTSAVGRPPAGRAPDATSLVNAVPGSDGTGSSTPGGVRRPGTGSLSPP